MSEEVRTKIPVDFSSGKYARPWQTSQEELVRIILYSYHFSLRFIREKPYTKIGCLR